MMHLHDPDFERRLSALERGESLPEDLPPEDAADLALAERLLALKEEPSARLAAAVEQTVVRPVPPDSKFRFPALRLPTSRRRAKVSARGVPWRRLAWGLVALTLVLAVTMVISPSTRAAVLDLIRKIAGMTFIETERYPGGGDVEIEGWWMATFVQEAPGNGSETQSLPTQSVSLAEAQAMLPAAFVVPAWAPEGFIQQDAVQVFLPSEAHPFPAYAMVCWEHISGQGFIYMHVLFPTGEELEQQWLVGLDSVEEWQIRGQPAALVRGAWDVRSEEYVEANMLALNWQEDGFYYSLTGFEDELGVSVNDLVRMAESMP